MCLDHWYGFGWDAFTTTFSIVFMEVFSFLILFVQNKYKKVYDENYKEYKSKLDEFYSQYPDAQELFKRYIHAVLYVCV